MMVKKVNIDELVQLLLDMRQTVEYVDMQIDAENVLKIRKHTTPPSTKQIKPFDEDVDLNDLFI